MNVCQRLTIVLRLAALLAAPVRSYPNNNLHRHNNMMKTLTIACLASAAMMTAAVAGSPVSAKNPKAPMSPAPAVACPGDISYSNVGLDWGHTWTDGDAIDGVNFDLSYAIVDKLYFHGTTSWSNTDFAEWGFTAGLGYGLSLVKNIDFVAEAGGFWANEGGGDGWYVFPHLRGKWGCFELHAGAKLLCPNHDDNQWEAHVNAYYEVARNVDLHVGGIFADDADTLQVGVRYKF